MQDKIVLFYWKILAKCQKSTVFLSEMLEDMLVFNQSGGRKSVRLMCAERKDVT